MHKTIGILAHVDAGKTTFSEQLLYHTSRIKKRGRVDHKDAFLDSHTIEKQRGITVFADQTTFTYKQSTYHLIDTPGHVDFSPEMERAIQVMDYAIVIVSAVEGVQGHTETVWQLLQKHRIPTFFFINKIDRVGANMEKVLADIRKHMTEDAFPITGANLEGNMDEALVEFLAERDEQLLEMYMEKGYDQEIWLNNLIDQINRNQVFPVMHGSALQDIGVVEFLHVFDSLTLTNYNNQEAFSGRVYKIRHDENGTRLTFIKALAGTLSVREPLAYGAFNQQMEEKVTQLRMYHGEKYEQVETVHAGELFAVTGLTDAQVGDGLGALKEKAAFEMIPTLKSKVIVDPSLPVKEALRLFQILDAEDPSLHVHWDERLQDIHIHVMGTVQLEVLEQYVKERFDLSVSFADPEIVYKETIEAPVVGYGHFEPLKHYAEVHLKIEPAERNSGISFENACHADDLSVGNQNLIRHHLFEREHHGLLTGSAVTDVKITLLTGRAHEKHTSGGDFREAAFRALRQGLEKANNLLLEPYYQFKIRVEIELMGRVISDIQQANGTFETPNTEGEKATITGTAPVATFKQYSVDLASFTQGKGSIHLTFAGYFPCHNQEEVIERIGYNKDADPEYSSSSIFCAKGKGYTVPWDKAEAYMHG
ncbi:small GTP-binding protein [Aquibacillus albus]|uniref:Small GTP-binding protein n=1 Tax=Aquibacillus albus TaxID=1168171 RepID=A0ABS2N3E5_9BACI|nr:TetM/TetW/TetO/TetS family tetracycline resistance ribosomal protection protein [Aquibacillus albus]MBM7572626.1 small GTP-binding protein [Aquibacillus albus]